MKEQIPEFTDKGVRDRVLAAWKLEHARPFALKHAESLAAEATKKHEPLKQSLVDQPDLSVITPQPFSWITFGNVPLGSAPSAARISPVEGIDAAGEQFMHVTFHLDPKTAGAAFNEPKDIAYAIYLVEFTPSEEVLWKQFEVDDFSKYSAAAQSDRRQMVEAWLDHIKQSAGFHWEREPDQLGEAAPVEED